MQEIIKWDDKYLTGIEVIDAHHKLIFSIVNELYQACERMDEKEKILEIISKLDFYTSDHFGMEEKCMLDFNYDAYLEHKQTHECFKSTYESIRKSYLYEKNQTVYIQALHLIQVLVEWLNHHIENEDQEIAIFFKKSQLENMGQNNE